MLSREWQVVDNVVQQLYHLSVNWNLQKSGKFQNAYSVPTTPRIRSARRTDCPFPKVVFVKWRVSKVRASPRQLDKVILIGAIYDSVVDEIQ